MTLRVFSNGGGVQSTAALVLAARGEIDYPIFIHANVGHDSENPATVRYIEEIHKPFAAAHGITFVDVAYHSRNGTPKTLLQHIQQSERSVPIPVWMANGAPGNRSCTADYKINVVDRWLKRNGASKHIPATVGLGISMDEFQRMRSPIDPKNPFRLRAYPLIELRLSRSDCQCIIADAGLPPAPKSSCWFCPFHRRTTWQAMHDTEPELFQQAVELEQLLVQRRAALGRDSAYLSPYGMPLDQVIMADQLSMDIDLCDSGYCHT